MPTYEYECPCHPGTRQELIRSMREAKAAGDPCPVCGLPRPRIVSVPADPVPFDHEFPYHDKAAGKVFHNRQEREAWAKDTDAKIKKRWGPDCELVEANA